MDEDADVWEDMLRSSLDKSLISGQLASAECVNSEGVTRNDRVQIQTGNGKDRDNGARGRIKKNERVAQRSLAQKPTSMIHTSGTGAVDASGVPNKFGLLLNTSDSQWGAEKTPIKRKQTGSSAAKNNDKDVEEDGYNKLDDVKCSTVNIYPQVIKDQSATSSNDLAEMPLSFTLGQSEILLEPLNERELRKPESPLSIKINHRLTLADAPYVLKALVTSSLAFEFWNEQVYHLQGRSMPPLMIRGLESVQNRLWAGQNPKDLCLNSSSQLSQEQATPYESFDAFVDDVISVLRLRAKWVKTSSIKGDEKGQPPPNDLAAQIGESIIDADSFHRGLKLINELKKLVDMSPEEIKEHVTKTIHSSDDGQTDNLLITPRKDAHSSGTLLGMITVTKKVKDPVDHQDTISSPTVAGPLSSTLLMIDSDSEKKNKSINPTSKDHHLSQLKAQTLEKWFKPTPSNDSPSATLVDDAKQSGFHNSKMYPLKLVNSPQVRNAEGSEPGNSPALDSGKVDYLNTPNQARVKVSKSPYTLSLTRKRKLTFPQPMQLDIAEKFNAHISSESNSPAAQELFAKEDEPKNLKTCIPKLDSLLDRDSKNVTSSRSVIPNLSDFDRCTGEVDGGNSQEQEQEQDLHPTQIDQQAQQPQILVHTSSDSLFLTGGHEANGMKSSAFFAEDLNFQGKKRTRDNEINRSSKRLNLQSFAQFPNKNNEDDEMEESQIFLVTPLSDADVQLVDLSESQSNANSPVASAVAELLANTGKKNRTRSKEMKVASKCDVTMEESMRSQHFSLLPLLRDLPGLSFRVSATLSCPSIDPNVQTVKHGIKLNVSSHSNSNGDKFFDINPNPSSSAVTTKGLRSVNQDACFVRTFDLPDRVYAGQNNLQSLCSGPVLVTAVCDGHGPLGKSAAVQTASFLCGDVGLRISTLESSGLSRGEAIRKGMKDSVRFAHELLVSLAEDQYEVLGSYLPDKLKFLDYGTTVSLAVIDMRSGSLVKNESSGNAQLRPIYLLNVGDSQSAIFVKQNLSSVSVQASPSWFSEIDEWAPGFLNWVKARTPHHTSSVFKLSHSTIRHDPFTMPEEFDRLWKNGQVVLVRSGGLPPVVLPQYEKPEAGPSTNLKKLAIDLFKEGCNSESLEGCNQQKPKNSPPRRSNRRQKAHTDTDDNGHKGVYPQAKSVRVFPADMSLSDARHSMLTLNMSRALGHRVLKNAGVSSDPSEIELVLVPTDEQVSIIMGTDGLWDKIDVKEIGQLLSRLYGCFVPRNERHQKRSVTSDKTSKDEVHVCAQWPAGVDESVCTSLSDNSLQSTFNRFREVSSEGCPKSLLCALLLTSLAEGRWRSGNSSESEGNLYGDNTSVCVIDLPVSD